MVTVVCYHNISDKSSSADVYTHYALVRLLAREGLLDSVFCLQFQANDLKGIKVVSIASHPLYYAVKKISRLSKKLLKLKTNRVILEAIFDWLVWRKLNKAKTKLLYSSKPILPNTFQNCTRHGIRTILRASVAHPLFNYYIAKNEEVKLGIASGSSYTNLKRTLKLTRCFHLANKVMINTGLNDPGFLLKTYSSCINHSKIIPYHQIFVTPDRPKVKDPSDRTTNTFIHVSHMNIIKGIHNFIDVWASLMKSDNHDAELILIGTIEPKLKQLIMEKLPSDGSKVQFTGYVKNPFEVYKHAKAFISPSLSDMGPATIIEALRAGIPVISTKTCGLSHLITDGYNGYTYDTLDFEKLKSILQIFITEKMNIDELKKNALKSCEQLNANQFNEEILALINKQL